MKGCGVLLFYDFEVFKHDWLTVVYDMDTKQKHVVINNEQQLKKLYEDNVNNIWVGFNNVHYDQYIMKAILLGINPKHVNDFIIVGGYDGWQYSSEFRRLPMINYDVMLATGRIGLKTIEGFMGSDIKETEVDFNIDRPLTDEEISETVRYCTHDVEQTIEAFMQTLDVFHATLGIIKAFPDRVNLSDIGDTEARITAKVLGCHKQSYTDEFDYYVLPCVKLKKYKFVQDWFEQKREEAKLLGLDKKGKYEKQAWYKQQSLEVIIAGVPHVFGFGGLHGAIEEAVHLSPKNGAGYHVDVNNYYPSLLIAWGLVTRAATNNNYKTIYTTRKELKMKQLSAKSREEAKAYKKMQLPYKKILNALSGGMKDETNPAYDPRNNNCMCINGQLMLLDLIEHLEVIPDFKLVQSNTDGLIVWIPDTDKAFNMMDEICADWEDRCSTPECDIRLAFDSLKSIYQKDVNNYLFIQTDGSVERIGRYLKPLSKIDNDLPILNKALVDYMIKGTPVETTIMNCNDLGMFQKIVKLSDKYDHVEHEHCTPHTITTGVRVKHEWKQYSKTDKYTYKCYRVFASKDDRDGRLLKVRGTGKAEKFGGTPDHCFIFNDSTQGEVVPEKLDKQYYIDEVKRTMGMFGIGE